MGRPKKTKVAEEKKEETEKPKVKCYCCGKDKKEIDFYMSKAFTYKAVGRMPVCKDCVGEVYNYYFERYNDEKTSLYYMCRNLNICFDESCYNASIKETKKYPKKTIWKVYMTKLNSLGSNNNGAGDDFDSSDSFNAEERMKETIKNESFEQDTIDFWGEGFSPKEYKYLNSEYEKMTTRYECDSYAQETLFQDIAFQRLEIRRKRQLGQSVDKELKTLQDLLGSANIKPAQENASMASEQLTFGTLIKKFENEKPIPEPLDEWKKNNWIHYMMVWFLGNLCNMMGKKNPYEEEWREEMDKYTVKPVGDEDE